MRTHTTTGTGDLISNPVDIVHRVLLLRYPSVALRLCSQAYRHLGTRYSLQLRS